MLRRLISNISSNDPVLNILQTDPESLFDKPFSGHIIFLFGELDEEIATWFSRAIISLDSLTGDDIACVVYAKKIRIAIDNAGDSHSQFSFRERRNSDGIIINHINKKLDAEVLVKDGKSIWTISTEETTAITYGADQIANALKISDQLPCIVFLDAILNNNKYLVKISELDKFIIPLQNYPVKDVISFLRKILQLFRNKAGYDSYLEDISKLEELSKEFENARYRTANLKKELSEIQQKKKIFIEAAMNSIGKANWSLMQGSKHYFVQELTRIPNLSLETVNVLTENIGADYHILVKYSKCIETLKYYLSNVNTISQIENQIRLKKIFTTYVEPLIDQSFQSKEFFSAFDCESTLDELRNRQNLIIGPYLSHLATSEEVELLAKQKFDDEINRLLQSYKVAEDEELVLQVKCESIAHRCIAPDHPSLVQVARDSFRGRIEKNETVQREYSLKWDFFIAHSGKDTDVAEILYADLSKSSKVFLDSKCLKYGDDWDIELSEAQQNSRISIVLVTPYTEKAYYQREEISAAIHMARNDKDRHRVVPIFLGLEDSNMAYIPYGLRLKHRITLGSRYLISSITEKLLALLQ